MATCRLAFAVFAALLVVAGGQKVNVSFYGESLCPFCARLTTEVLHPIFTSSLGELINFRYYGWGNVFQQGDEYKCQHGPLECKMNTVLNCGQDLSIDQDQFFGFLFCIESQAGPNVDAQIPGCAKAANLELGKLEDCYKGEKGKELSEAAKNATDALKPAHTYVPWVTVNGVPLFEETDNLASYICVAYTGEKPEECFKPPRKPSQALHFSRLDVWQLA